MRTKTSVEEKDLAEVIGARIKAEREAEGLTQQQLGVAIGRSQRTIGAWELGERTPSALELVKLGQHFETSVDYLAGLTNTRSVNVDIQTAAQTTCLREDTIRELQRLKGQHFAFQVPVNETDAKSDDVTISMVTCSMSCGDFLEELLINDKTPELFRMVASSMMTRGRKGFTQIDGVKVPGGPEAGCSVVIGDAGRGGDVQLRVACDLFGSIMRSIEKKVEFEYIEMFSDTEEIPGWVIEKGGWENGKR